MADRSEAEVGEADETEKLLSKANNKSEDESSSVGGGERIDEGGRRNDKIEIDEISKCYTVLNVVFCIFCFISGQLLIHCERKWKTWVKALIITVMVLSVIPAVIFLSSNIGSLAFDTYAVLKCPYPNCGIIAGPFVEESSLNGSSNITDIQYHPTKDKGYFTFQDAVITIATISGSLSYLIMMFRVLIVKYSLISWIIHIIAKKLKTYVKEKPRNCCSFLLLDVYKCLKSEVVINPFLHCESANFQPAILNGCQSFYFYLIFIFCLLLYGGNVGTLFYIAVQEDNKKFPPYYTPIDYAGLAVHLASQYCAIISCFIFSKVAYAVSLRCHEQLEKYNDIIRRANANDTIGNSPQHGTGTGDNDTQPGTGTGAGNIQPGSGTGVKILKDLEEKDREYVELCNKSMKPYRLWFAVHWFLYALSSFMAIAYLVETILDRDDYNKVNHERVLTLTYVGLFTLQHMVLFLYPCFRAASLLEARNTLIHKVSLQYDWNPNIKSKFIQFMQVQRCGFLLSLGCIRIEFGFNIAYLSIFFGFIGLVIKVFALT